MPYLPTDTRAAFGGETKVDNRSLYFDRYADPLLQKEERVNWFLKGMRISVPGRSQTPRFPARTEFLYGMLRSRLLLHMSGGVMENAGLCLDRYGMPYIPGSAVKGCARRAALRALREWTASGRKPAGPLNPVLNGFSAPGEMLADIAHTFGWVEQDWTDDKSDLLWACSENKELLGEARKAAGLKAGSHAGSVIFFAAYPDKDPGLELDILTCHHGDYYSDTEADFAPDTEEPNPVSFPAVKAQTAGGFFAFALAPMRPVHARLLPCAKAWLQVGLEVFGLGAKTAAGYGWFEVAETTPFITAKLKERAEKQLVQQADSVKNSLRLWWQGLSVAALEDLRDQTQDPRGALAVLKAVAGTHKQTDEGVPWFGSDTSEKNLLSAWAAQRPALVEKILSAKSADLDPEAQADLRIGSLTDQQFVAKVERFTDLQAQEKAAVVRLLHGARRGAWDSFKARAAKGKLAQAADAIRQTSKSLNLGKMP